MGDSHSQESLWGLEESMLARGTYPPWTGPASGYRRDYSGDYINIYTGNSVLYLSYPE
ncbi:hypothetical protein EYZ11_010747 [Aspergillus tanneri]|uniref:Uncharacterized protein n=1 Tax=Aspergillus tanneri TaxID=1220188 RepID=A0A4S3J4J5_9EURO|nr:hypothetical protein EYZ11_010747 [Aspergillus tanneri]